MDSPTQPTQFHVDRCLSAQEVAGRCGERDIPMDATFQYLRMVQVNRRSAVAVACDDRGIIAELALKLVGVEHYPPKIDFVPGGHTAILTLEGDTGVAHDQLKDLQPEHYLILECCLNEDGCPTP